jgi:hypothetical protein
MDFAVLGATAINGYRRRDGSGNAMLRLVDQPRPLVWRMLAPFSQRYRVAHEARELPDWQRIVLRRAVFVEKLNLLYVRNAKAASSSLRDMMFELAGGSREAGPGEALYFPTPEWRKVIAALADPGVFRFTVGRHPVDRALSAFSNLFVTAKNGFSWRHRIYAGRSGLRFGDGSSENFDRFLDYVEEVQAESALYCDAHLRLQTHNTGARHMEFARVGHYETLPGDVAAIMEAAGVASFRPEMLGWFNRSRGEGALVPTAAQVRRIEGIYAEDYERFGYPKGLH